MPLFLLLLFTTLVWSQTEVEQTVLLMGNRFDITVVANDEQQANQYIEMAIEEIKRIENLISSWLPTSETSLINRYAGIRPVVVSDELYRLIERAISISKLTQGAFDISYASMDKIWFFDGSMNKMPAQHLIEKARSKVGYQNINLNPETSEVFLTQKEMKIGFGAIGKGYAADQAKNKLQQLGVKSGLINASGDMITWGSRTDGSPWKVGIKNPLKKNKLYSWFDLSERAVVTSGNYEKFVIFNNKRYSHIIDPRTGYPAHGIASCSVFAPKAELADAMATATFVIGVQLGLFLINQIPDVECLIIDDNGMMHASEGLILEKK